MADLIVNNSGYATGAIDSAQTLINRVSPHDAKHINGPASAIVQIEETLGIAPSLKGSQPDLVARLAVGIDSAGRLNLSTDTALNGPLSANRGGTGQATPLLPTGSIICWSTTSAPLSFVLCDGGVLSRALQPTLFAVIGTTYGIGDGITTFNVPDLRGRVVIMVDGSANRITASSTNGGNADTIGGVGGAQTHTLVSGEMPAHTHDENADSAADGSGGSRGIATLETENTVSNDATLNVTSSTGGGAAHSNTQPWMALEYIIKL